MNTKITDVFLQPEYYNPVCRATIPPAWIAVINGCHQVIGRPSDFKNKRDAMEYAEYYFANYG